MKIAVLTSVERCDKYTNPDWVPEGTELVHIGSSYSDADVLSRAGDAEVILVDPVLPVSGNLIRNMPRLKMVHAEGVGYNLIDVAAAAEAGVYVCNNKGVNAGPVAEHTVLLMLALMRRFSEGEEMMRQGRQTEAKTGFIKDGLRDLGECSVGIVGFGAIGKELARRLAPFGCRMFYYNRRRCAEQVEAEYGVTYLERDELFAQSDIITLHVPATPDTTGMICRETLAMMKPSAIVINCARGAVVNSADLAEAIKDGVIYGAGLDTIDPEPVPADDPVVMLPEPYKYRVALSPHIAGTTRGVFVSSYRMFWENVRRLYNGERPNNIVNGL